MYYLFSKYKKEAEYIQQFKSMKALNNYIKEDIKMMRKEWPEERWSKKDYIIGKRIK